MAGTRRGGQAGSPIAASLALINGRRRSFPTWDPVVDHVDKILRHQATVNP